MRSDADEEGGIMTFENSLRVDFPFLYVRPSVRPSVQDAHRARDAREKTKHGGRSSRCLLASCVARACRDVVHAGVFDAVRVILMASCCC